MKKTLALLLITVSTICHAQTANVEVVSNTITNKRLMGVDSIGEPYLIVYDDGRMVVNDSLESIKQLIIGNDIFI